MKKNTNVKLNDLLGGLVAAPEGGEVASGLAVRAESLPEISGGMKPVGSTCEGCCNCVSDKTVAID